MIPILLIVLAIVTVVWIIGTIVAVKITVTRPKSSEINYDNLSDTHKIRYKIRQRNNQHLYDMKPEDVTIENVFSNTLHAWFVPKPGSKKFVICVHGYKCNGPDEFSHMLPFYSDVLGFNYLLPDHNAHGRSEGKHIGFGSYESKDILHWVNYLVDRFGEDIEIVLHGISMGAATVMLANESNPPKQVKAVIEDCGYTSAYDIILNTMKSKIGLRCPPLFWGLNLACRLFYGYNLRDADCIGRMKDAKKPMLFIHGTGDTFVPFAMGEKLYEACESVPKDKLYVKDAIHAYSYYDGKQEYEAKVIEFLSNYMDISKGEHIFE